MRPRRRRVPAPDPTKERRFGWIVLRRLWSRALCCRGAAQGLHLLALGSLVLLLTFRASLRVLLHRFAEHRGCASDTPDFITALGQPRRDVEIQIPRGQTANDAGKLTQGARQVAARTKPTPRAMPMATAIGISTIRVLRPTASSASSRASKPSAANFCTSLVIDRSACVIRSVIRRRCFRRRRAVRAFFCPHPGHCPKPPGPVQHRAG